MSLDVLLKYFSIRPSYQRIALQLFFWRSEDLQLFTPSVFGDLMYQRC